MKYFVWLKTNPAKTNDTLKTLRNSPQKTYQGVNLYYTMKCSETGIVDSGSRLRITNKPSILRMTRYIPSKASPGPA